jgi:arylsulfatase A-like enzyme
LIPYLSGQLNEPPHGHLFWRTDFNRAVLHGDWKFVWNERDGQEFLYKLKEDPGEHHNLSTSYPEEVEKLKMMIIEWESEMMDPLWPGVMEFRFNLDGEITLWSI